VVLVDGYLSMNAKSRLRRIVRYQQEELAQHIFARALASAYRFFENIVVAAELKFRDVERHIFAVHLVERTKRPDDSAFNAEYRPIRTYLVTTGLDPVVHGGTRRVKRHGETERAGSLHGLPDQVRQ
jgi:hypothetical protein